MTGAHDASISHAGSPGAGGKAGHQGHSAGGTINGQSGHGQSTTGNRRTSLLSEEAMRWDGHLSDKGEEFAVHLGIDLENPEDRQHAWIAETAVNEVLPDGWSQHEDEEGERNKPFDPSMRCGNTTPGQIFPGRRLVAMLSRICPPRCR